MMDIKSKYKLFCKEYEEIMPIYIQHWWLDAVCNSDKWNIILYENNDRIEAVMLYYSPLKSILIMPPYTQNLGIWFVPDYELENSNSEIFRKQEISSYFISKLPKHKFFAQKFSSQYTDWLPFYWNNYYQTTFYNYLLKDIKNIDEKLTSFRRGIKNNIKIAAEKEKLSIKTNISIDDFITLTETNLKRKKVKDISSAVLKRLMETAIERNQGRIYASYDPQNNIHDAVFVAWSGNTAYNISVGRNPQFIKSSGMAFLMFNTIKDISLIVDNFDFEGSMIKGVEFFFRGFGAEQKQYFYITKGKINIFDRIVKKVKNLF